MVNSFIWLFAGAVIGWLATSIIRRRHPILLLNIIVGSVGAFLAGYWLSPLFRINTASFSWSGLLVSLGGTIVLLAFFNFVVREHTMTNSLLQASGTRCAIKSMSAGAKSASKIAIGSMAITTSSSI